ncbi:MAG: GreA/GreB family elongation factor [Archangium sp.]|nr:GreA/GreB family elongation factor [Archangium sp.]
MSKAFTSEETPDDPVLGRPVARVVRGQERPITIEGYRALVNEQEHLKAERLAEKEEARRLQLDHRLALISATLENVKVVNVPPPDGTVRFGSTVTLEWEDGKRQTLRLVGRDEANGDAISVESPLARVLLEQREGDEVEVVRPRGVASAVLLSVK